MEQDYISKAFETNFVAPVGPQLNDFEKKVELYLGGKNHCVALSSGSAALHLALRIAGVETGDEVWISSMTFAGGIFPLNYLGAIPNFFDLDPKTWTLDADLIAESLREAKRMNKLPKVIVPTDLYGQSVDLDAFEDLAKEYGVKLIIDSAESLGASFKDGRKAGTGGDASIFSFNGNKIITTSGGGMFVTRNKEWAQKARFLASQARDEAPHYEHSTYGYNYRLSNICAAIGIAQMEVLDSRVNRRREIFFRYKEALVAKGFTFMPEPLGYKSSRWLTIMLVNPEKINCTREDIRLELLKKSIESRPVWKPMHMQPLYSGSRYYGKKFDEYLFNNGLCLPSGSDMTNSQQDEVIETIVSMLNR